MPLLSGSFGRDGMQDKIHVRIKSSVNTAANAESAYERHQRLPPSISLSKISISGWWQQFLSQQ